MKETYNWIIKENYLLGIINKKINFNLINRIFLLDIDGTIIIPKSGKIFPIDKNDWIFISENVVKILNKTKNNELIGLISNQKGLKTNILINDWIYKMNNICSFIKVDFIFASLKNDELRKPLSKSIDLIKEQFPNLDFDNINIQKKIIYIGDALGRKDDHSDVDLKFSINNKFQLISPEQFFNLPNNLPNNFKDLIKYPKINYFSNQNQNSFFEKLFDLIKKKIKQNNNIYIMMIGFPGCGKTYLRDILLNKFPMFNYTNDDDLKNNNLINKDKKNELLVKKESNNNYIINDNTNMNSINNSKLLKKYENYYKIGILFDYSLDVCMHLNYTRMYWFKKKLISKIVYNTLNKKFNKNIIEKEFEKFIIINYVFNNFNYDDKIKYYF